MIGPVHKGAIFFKYNNTMKLFTEGKRWPVGPMRPTFSCFGLGIGLKKSIWLYKVNNEASTGTFSPDFLQAPHFFCFEIFTYELFKKVPILIRVKIKFYYLYRGWYCFTYIFSFRVGSRGKESDAIMSAYKVRNFSLSFVLFFFFFFLVLAIWDCWNKLLDILEDILHTKPSNFLLYVKFIFLGPVRHVLTHNGGVIDPIPIFFFFFFFREWMLKSQEKVLVWSLNHHWAGAVSTSVWFLPYCTCTPLLSQT